MKLMDFGRVGRVGRVGLSGLMLLALRTEAQPATDVVEVIGRTPLGTPVPIDQVAANVQQATGDMLREQHSLALADFMQRSFSGVFVNEAQSNPLQPDVQYRGFVGSPLLGLSQGIAVYQDGVRLNEPFGDTINWALIPDSAIDSLYLMPGSNPLFGLNALGGAVSIRTRDGFTGGGTSVEFEGGSFGRISLAAGVGGADETWGYLVAAERVEEDGWRDYSPSESTQLFGKLSWRADATDIDLSLALAETDLVGNGAAPAELLAQDRSAIFTRPDITENALALLNLETTHEFSAALAISGNLYLRKSDIDTYNGDDSDFEACEDETGFLCNGEDDESLLLDANGEPVPATEAVTGAVANRTWTRQNAAGFGVQGVWTTGSGGHDNVLVAGLAYDAGAIDFAANAELGTLDATRLALPGGVFVGDSFTDLKVDTTSVGLYLSNTRRLTDKLTLTVSGRYNDVRVRLRDQIGAALNGDHAFRRFNPAIGLTAALGETLTLYAGYSESSRAPSPVELTCADPEDPCRLPNAFLADPPLDQVVAGTLEAGFRGRRQGFDWHAGVFRTTSRDDILFISAGALTGEGFFDNVGRTHRDGVELNVNGTTRRDWRWFANYTLLDATFGETLMLPSPNSPAALEGEVLVQPGDDLPLTPDHLLRLGLRVPMTERLSVGFLLRASSGFHLRGDEGNDLPEIGSHAALDLRGDYRFNDRFRLVFSVDNVFDTDYETFGLFGEPDEVLGDEFEDSRFLSPAAPRAAWLGIRLEL